MEYPKVSIIILNWNGLKDTVECLESLKKIIYPNYNIIVVDNGSSNDDVKALQTIFGEYIKIIANDRNYGFTGGTNIGIRYALNITNPQYLLSLNNDTIVDPEFLDKLIEVAESDTSIGIIGPKIYFYDFPNTIQSLGNRLNFATGQISQIGNREQDDGRSSKNRNIDFISVCLLIRAKVLDDIGLFDNDYFCYWEDVDLCNRAKKAGYKIMYAPSAKIWHKLEKSSANKLGLVDYYIARNRFRFMKKNATRCQYLSFFIYFFAYYIWLVTGSRIYRQKMKQLPAFYRGVRDGLFNHSSNA